MEFAQRPTSASIRLILIVINAVELMLVSNYGVARVLMRNGFLLSQNIFRLSVEFRRFYQRQHCRSIELQSNDRKRMSSRIYLPAQHVRSADLLQQQRDNTSIKDDGGSDVKMPPQWSTAFI